MSYPIKLSKSYITTLKNFLNIAKKSEILLFKENDISMISLMDMGTLVHISTTANNLDFADEELGITNIGDFTSYIKAIGYPDNGSIVFSQETSTKGKTIPCFVFSNDSVTYRMVIADPNKFEKKYAKKVPKDRSSDPMELVGRFKVTVDDIDAILMDMKLMGKDSETFGLYINSGKISLYMRGIQGQQTKRTIDGLKSQVIGGFSTESEGLKKYKLFPSKIFQYMAYFGCDFDVEIRILRRGQSDYITSIKTYGVVTTPGSDDINVFIGCPENEAEICANNFDVIK